MTINELIKDKFEGKRLISINGNKVDETIEKVELGEVNWATCVLFITLKKASSGLRILKLDDNFEIEESGM